MSEPPYQYEYPRPAVAVDVIIVRVNYDGSREMLLIERGNEPFKGLWALPGGFLEENETLAEGAARELKEETGVEVSGDHLTQLEAYSQVDRDPRTRVISVIYFALLESNVVVKAGDDAANAEWYCPDELPELAFDHDKIVSDWDSMIRSWDGDTQTGHEH